MGLCYQCCLGIHARGGPCPFCRTKLDQIVTIDRRYPLYNAEGNVLFRVTGPNLEDVGTVKPDLDAAAHAERDDAFDVAAADDDAAAADDATDDATDGDATDGDDAADADVADVGSAIFVDAAEVGRRRSLSDCAPPPIIATY